MEGELIWVVNTQYSVQMMCCKIIHLKPIYFVNRCHPNKFNKKEKIRFCLSGNVYICVCVYTHTHIWKVYIHI